MAYWAHCGEAVRFHVKLVATRWIPNVSSSSNFLGVNAVKNTSPPKAGLSPEQALKNWSSAEQYSAMEQLSQFAMSHSNETVNLHFEYTRRREALEKAFVDRLGRGEIFCSAIAQHGDDREIIKPALWAVYWVEYDFDQIAGNGRLYEAAEFFGPNEIPGNVIIPEWFTRYTDERNEAEEFWPYDDTYRHVKVRRLDFTLSEIQASVIRQLHEASFAGEGWMNGKILLEAAGATGLKMSDYFKPKARWAALLKSDGRGAYRLNLTDK
jgi:hypothetical protein